MRFGPVTRTHYRLSISFPLVTTAPRHDEWAARDAAVVWHGFTQMATYAENRPIIVDRAEGHEVIDVDGHRYLDAISSLWVTTLGHHVPELDDAVRRAARARSHTPRCSATAIGW